MGPPDRGRPCDGEVQGRRGPRPDTGLVLVEGEEEEAQVASAGGCIPPVRAVGWGAWPGGRRGFCAGVLTLGAVEAQAASSWLKRSSPPSGGTDAAQLHEGVTDETEFRAPWWGIGDRCVGALPRAPRTSARRSCRDPARQGRADRLQLQPHRQLRDLDDESRRLRSVSGDQRAGGRHGPLMGARRQADRLPVDPRRGLRDLLDQRRRHQSGPADEELGRGQGCGVVAGWFEDCLHSRDRRCARAVVDERRRVRTGGRVRSWSSEEPRLPCMVTGWPAVFRRGARVLT